jgi:hypothetical protein
MAFLIQVLRFYGWYIAAVMTFCLLLGVGVWLRLSLTRWWRDRVGAKRGHTRPFP